MAVLAGVGGILFWLSFHSLDAEEKALNELPDAKYTVDDSSREFE